MKIGILSDSHTKAKRAKEAITMLIDEGAEFLIHAGDIGDVEVLKALKESYLRYVAVYGNNDAHLAHFHGQYNLVQEPHYFKLENTKFKLMHLPYYMNADSEVIIFGHTHEFSVEFTSNGTLYLNPGESCARNKPLSECVLLEVTDDEFLVTYYAKKPKDLEFKYKKFSYKRLKK
jgi:putative phosphoesterase